MLTPWTRSAPIASAARTAQTLESIPPGEAEDDGAEPVLRDVVAQAEDEGVPELLVVARELGDSFGVSMRACGATRPAVRGSSAASAACAGRVPRSGVSRAGDPRGTVREEEVPDETAAPARAARRRARRRTSRRRDEVVLPADDVHVGDRARDLRGAPGRERQAHLVLVALERRRVDDEEEVGAGVGDPRHRAVVEPQVPRR